MKGAFDPDCSRLLQDCCATQPEMLHRSLWQQKTACRVCRIHLNYRCLTEEERKSHFLNAGRNASRLQTCSHPFYKAALTRLKKGSCPLPWRSLLYYSLTNQKSRLTRNLFLGGIFQSIFHAQVHARTRYHTAVEFNFANKPGLYEVSICSDLGAALRSVPTLKNTSELANT